VDINVWAVIVAAASAFLLGGLWYGPLFLKVWQRENGGPVQSGHPVKVFGGAFVLSLIAAAVFAAFLGPNPETWFGTSVGFAAGLGWVATSYGINYLFAQRSFKLWLVDGGYHTLQFTLYGFILGVWP
jgi:hypothetical protein